VEELPKKFTFFSNSVKFKWWTIAAECGIFYDSKLCPLNFEGGLRSMGKLIVIEGTDGSGKSTQFRLLTQRLTEEGQSFKCLEFPRYSEPSSTLIKMYLGGEFGSKPSDVNSYAASTFYAVDRYASYKQDWGKWYEEGGLVLTGRYTTSNAVHQASKEQGENRDA
jgi:thymidylate kinase